MPPSSRKSTTSRNADQEILRSPKSIGSSTAMEPTRERRHRSTRTMTCTNCRIRKTRCDGTQPGCKTCEVYEDECRYERPPPMSQIIAMAKRLQEAEQTIADLKSKNTVDEFISRERMKPPEVLDQPTERPESSNPTSIEPLTEPQEKDTLVSDLSLDENGNICYHGPTSAVYLPPNLEQGRSPASVSSQPSKVELRSMLTAQAMDLRSWEDFALGNVTSKSDIPRREIDNLLQIHWSWISPMFSWVYRPAFMRDMANDGAYFSEFLLVVLCAHAARFHKPQIGDMLIARARILLGAEISKPSSIPTVQALLQLSARDLAFGLTSQAWLYSGMAFRMVSDLGLHHVSHKSAGLGQLSVEDVEIRIRLFWSCYFWDKAISLYLGRLPALTDLPSNAAQSPELLDDFTEHELWNPYYGESGNLSEIPKMTYPRAKAHTISCFENSCKLAVILNDIIIRLYSRRASSESESPLRSLETRLQTWRQQSPAHLVYDPESLPDISPPPHIITQNLLYFATVILLHRPFYSSDIHHAACRNASDSIEKLLLLIEHTYGFTKVTYLMAYCIYTAASARIPDVRKGEMGANAKMATFLRALNGGVKSCPIVQRSLDIINNNIKPSGHQLRRTANVVGSDSPNYLPAFPYQPGYMEDVGFASMDLDASLLECFPENYMQNTDDSNWYGPLL